MNEFIVGAATALGKNLVGWIKNSLADGKIQAYEWKKLVETIIVTLIIFAGAFYSLEYFNADNAEWISSAISLLLSPLWDLLKAKFKWNF